MSEDFMIVNCPACSGKLRLDRQRHAGKKVALRCPRCRHVFHVGVEAQGGGNEAQVLIAHGDPTVRAAISEILVRGGVSSLAAEDGHEVLRCLKASKPKVAIIDVALGGIMAFEVVERIRSTPELSALKIILLSSVYNKTAYKRRPSSLYGADDYIEKHHLSDWLLPKVRQLAALTPANPAGAVAKQPQPMPREIVPSAFATSVNSKILHAEEDPLAGQLDQDMEKAKRLARIIIADIALYNQERVEEGICAGNLETVLANELEEGRRLFASRISEEIRAREDFLKKALEDFIAPRTKTAPKPLPVGV